MVKVMTQYKKTDLGQVFTPVWMVEKILDTLDYTVSNPDILSKTVLEPSVGEGVFLQEMVRRILHVSRQHKYSDETIQALLESNIHGVDVDPLLVDRTIDNLNSVLEKESFRMPVQWSIQAQNAIKNPPSGVYDVVVGNPPYVRLISDSDRKALRQLRTQQGALNLYTAFFELGLTHWLSDTGVMAYIAPNTWVKNMSTRSLRELMVTGQHIREVIDYSAIRVFEEEAETYTAVTVMTKQANDNFTYTTMLDTQSVESHVIVPYTNYKDYKGEPLVFASGTLGTSSGVTLQDICSIQTGAQLSGVKIFVNPDVEIEEAVRVPAVRGNDAQSIKTEHALFPYKHHHSTDLFGNTVSTSVIGLSEHEMKQYPVAYEYLLSHHEALSKRSLGKGSQWFHYGRNQGLEAVFENKLALSPVIRKNAQQCQAHFVPQGTLIYSGLIITLKDEQYSLEDIQSIIGSPEFVQYAWNHAPRDISGGYRVFNAGNVRNFYIPTRYLSF